MQLNTATKYEAFTHGGSKAFAHLKPIQELRRAVLSCLLWESQFYESGEDIASRILSLSEKVSKEELSALAIEARHEHNLRHVSLLLLVALCKKGGKAVADCIERVISRADELSEFLSLYWASGKTPIAKQAKKGLAAAFRKFDAYQLAKYDRAKAIRLRDVLFMVHAKPKDDNQATIWKQLVDGTLPSPDTWEVALSAGADKKATFERLMSENNLGYLALLRNLRNMTEAGVDTSLIRAHLKARKGAQRVLPFRYVAAARACPQMEPDIDKAFLKGLAEMPKLKGRTVAIIDTSGSMGAQLSAKSDMTRMDAACALGAILREVCEDPHIFATAGNDWERKHKTAYVPARRGMALVDATQRMQKEIGGGGIFLKQVMDYVHKEVGDVDRVIVITDEQDCDTTNSPSKARIIGKTNYIINVASYENDINFGNWTTVNGFSENVLKWIYEMEAQQ